MSLLRHAKTMMLLWFIGALAATAQQQTVNTCAPELHWPWWGYSSVVVDGRGFTSITGLTGTSQLTGSSGLYCTDPVIDYTFLSPFSFPMGGSNYLKARISINGCIQFDPSSTPTSPFVLLPYDLMPTGPQRLVMPFWGALQSAGRTGGGIYLNYSPGTDPSAGDDTLTIEWRVTSPTAQSGSQNCNFQAKLCGNGLITFVYDIAGSPVAWDVPSGSMAGPYGAAIGIKHIGMTAPSPSAPSPPCNVYSSNNSNFSLLVPAPESTSGLAAYTRQQLVQTSGGWQPDWLSTDPLPVVGAASDAFRFEFPPSGANRIRIKPVNVELGTDSLKGGDSSHHGWFSTGQKLEVQIRIRNNVSETATNVGVRADLFGPGKEHRDSIFTTVPSVPGFGSVTVTFRDSLGRPSGLSPGTYLLQGSIAYAGDADQSNDTIRTRIHVVPATNAAVVGITAPMLADTLAPYRYARNSSITPSVRIANTGTDSLPAAQVVCELRNLETGIAYRDTQHVSPLPPGITTVQFRPESSLSNGTYTVKAFVRVAGDAYAGDDTLEGQPEEPSEFRDGTAPELRTFMVVEPRAIAVGSPAHYPSIPAVEGSYLTPLRPAVTLVDDGPTAPTVVNLLARIDTIDGTPRGYDTLNGFSIAGGTSRAAVFPKAFNGLPGHYRITIRIADSTDSDSSNDVASWTFFTLGGISAAPVAEAPRTAGSMTIIPSPASDDATIAWDSPHRGTAHLYLTDMYGTVAREFAIEGGEHALHVRTAELPSGMYFVHLEEPDGLRIIRKLIVQH